MVEQLALETISKHVKDTEKKIIKSSQHPLTEGTSCLANLASLCDEVTGLVDEWIVYLGCSKAFDTPP